MAVLKRKRERHPLSRPCALPTTGSIRDKWVGRGPNFWRKRDLNLAFDPGDPGCHGLTLKQKGWWGFAMGVSDETLPSPCLTAI
jgi:hypothetical protein